MYGKYRLQLLSWNRTALNKYLLELYFRSKWISTEIYYLLSPDWTGTELRSLGEMNLSSPIISSAKNKTESRLRPNAAAWLPKDQFVPECRPDAPQCSSLPMKQASSSSTSPNQFPAAVKIDSISTSLAKIYSVLVAPRG